MQQPDNLKGAVPIEVEDYDPVPYFLSALPITLAVLGTQSAHEVAHRVVASTKKVHSFLLLSPVTGDTSFGHALDQVSRPSCSDTYLGCSS